MIKTTQNTAELNKAFPHLKKDFPDLYIKFLEKSLDLQCEQVLAWMDFVDDTNDRWKKSLDKLVLETV